MFFVLCPNGAVGVSFVW